MSAAVIGYMPMPVNFEYRSLFLHGRPKHEKYDDFWRKHPPMDTFHRAKIFSAFDALAGFGDCIASKEVQYSDRRHLSEEEHEKLDKKLSVLRRLTRRFLIRNKILRSTYLQIYPQSTAVGSIGTRNLPGILNQKNDDVRLATIKTLHASFSEK